MKRLSAIASVLVALGAAAFGCGGRAPPLGIVSRNLSVAFDAERKIPNRITAPRRADAGVSVLWVGHATMLVQIDDRFVLTDPVFTRFVGQLSRRLVEPGIALESVPPIDVALISHMHFDHLSLGSLDLLEGKLGAVVVPDGGAGYLPGFSFPIHSLATWQTVELGDVRVTAVPVDHVGWRYGLDRTWMHAFSGYVIEHHGKAVYVGGDTAYAREKFVATRARFPHLDVAILPIAPLAPRDFMKHTHVDPAEAVQAFLDLGADRMVPMHFDTFVNSVDAPGDARRELLRVVHERSLEDRVVVLEIGEQRVLVPR